MSSMNSLDDDDGEFLGGRLLIAMPGISDPRFERAVIFMCAHSPQYAMGITLNQPVEGLTMPDLLQRLGIELKSPMEDRPVLAGGPVDRERGFVLHSDDFETPDSTLAITEGIALTATRDVLDAMADVHTRPRHAVLALGCAQWEGGQLEREIRESVWLSCDTDAGIVFDDDYDTKWERALAKIGVRADQLSTQTGQA
jgi:putative transcriptional regulator